MALARHCKSRVKLVIEDGQLGIVLRHVHPGSPIEGLKLGPVAPKHVLT
jgi:hypothetical protein